MKKKKKKFYPKINSFPINESEFKRFSSLPLIDINEYKDKIEKLNESLNKDELSRNKIGKAKEFNTYHFQNQLNIRNKGIEYFENEDYKNALIEFNKLIDKHPSDENYYWRAKTFLKINKYNDSINDCNNAIKKNRRCVKANLIKAQCHVNMGYLRQAKMILQKGLDVSNEIDELYSYRLKFAEEINNVNDIENSITEVKNLINNKEYKKALEELEITMIKCSNKTQYISQSKIELSKLLNEDMKGIPFKWKILRGNLLIMDNNYAESMKIAKNILNIDQRNTFANALQIKLLYIMGKRNTEDTLKNLKKLNSTNEKIRLLIKKIKEIDERKNYTNNNSFKNKKYEDAIKKYDNLIIECKDVFLTGTVLIILMRNKSTCLLELKKYKNCIKCINEALMILKKIVFPNGDPKTNEVYQNCKQQILFSELFRKRAECFIKIDQFEDAKKDIEILKYLTPHDEKFNELNKMMNNVMISNNKKEEGNKAFKNGDYEDALRFYNEAIELYKESCKYYCNRGLTNMKLYNYNSAIEDFKNSYKLNNEHVKAIINLSKCYLQILQPNNAVIVLEKNKPDINNSFYKKYEEELIIAKKIKDAYENNENKSHLSFYDNLLNIYKDEKICNFVEIIILKERINCFKNNNEKINFSTVALDRLDKLLNNRNNNYNNINCNHKEIYEELFNIRAKSYADERKYDKAIKDYEILINLSNKNDYKNNLLLAKQNKRKMNEAENYQKAGSQAYDEKKYKKAINEFTKAIEECPYNNSIYYFNRASAYMMIFKYLKAIEDCKKAIEFNENYIPSYKILTKCYFQLNKPNLPISYLQSKMYSCPNDNILKEMFEKANSLNEIKNEIESSFNSIEKINNYKLLIKKYNEYEITGYIEYLLYKELAELYNKEKNYEESNKKIKKSIKKLKELAFENISDVEDINAYKNSEFYNEFIDLFKIRAENYINLNSIEKAVKDYKFLYNLCPDDSDIYNNLKRVEKSEKIPNVPFDSNINYTYPNSNLNEYSNPNLYECYEILGLNINNNPSSNEIKKAYHCLARKHHSDKNQNKRSIKENDELMKTLNTAYNKLKTISIS